MTFLLLLVWLDHLIRLLSPTDAPSLVTCHANENRTRFYLDPWDGDDEASCAGSDWYILGALFLLVHGCSWIPRWYIYEPVWYRLRPPLSSSSSSSLQTTTTTAPKFSQSLTAASFHGIMAYLAYQVLQDEPWLYDRHQWVPDDSHTMSLSFKLYYLLYAVRYTSDLLSLPWEPVRSVRVWCVFVC